MAGAATVPLEGMPERDELKLWRGDGTLVVTCGRRVLFRFDGADTGMRNLAVVALAEAGAASGQQLAVLFGLSEGYVSKLRVRARRKGSGELVRPLGRPPKLDERDAATARRWSAQGVTGTVIASRLGVSDATVSRVLAGGVRPLRLLDPDETPGGRDAGSEGEEPGDGAVALRPAGSGERVCRYAGAMLLWPFLQMVDAGGVLAPLVSGPARRFDSVRVALSVMFGFVLGAGTVEGTKHLARAELGALVGVAAAPELRTVRRRLAVMAAGCDPLGLQQALVRALIASAAPPEQVFFVDDHFVPYYGARPLAKGWNTKRRHAQRGRDDTYICDLAGRALCFTSSEPSGLSQTMRGVLAQLRAVCPAGTPITLGFDRGGSYPVAFSWLREQGVTWITWRRGDLAVPAVTPRRSWFALDGRRHHYTITDETVALGGYGPARQVTLYEAGEAVAQILSSDTVSTPARLVHLLRCRWRIENAFKYLAEHHGIDSLCDYRMDIVADDRQVPNPERTAARATLRSLNDELAATEQALGATLTTRAHRPNTLAELARLRDQHAIITDEIEDAGDKLRSHRAKLAATDLDPDATRALPRLERRSLQMVLRLLAYNAEHWLAERLDAYLADPDEVRAITRHLLHQPGSITSNASDVTVTITRPDQPRVAHAVELLTDELNTTPAHIAGDPRQLTYRIASTPQPGGTTHPPLPPEV